MKLDVKRLGLIVIGENINTTRNLRASGPRVVVEGGKPGHRRPGPVAGRGKGDGRSETNAGNDGGADDSAGHDREFSLPTTDTEAGDDAGSEDAYQTRTIWKKNDGVDNLRGSNHATVFSEIADLSTLKGPP